MKAPATLLLSGLLALSCPAVEVHAAGISPYYHPVAGQGSYPRQVYRPRPPRPVAIPERGAPYTTGQIGNYSAVPLPEDFNTDDTAVYQRSHDRYFQRQGQVRERRVNPPENNERKVIDLRDNVRTVRPR